MSIRSVLSMAYLPPALCLLLLSLWPGRVLAQSELTVLNWPDYLDPELMEAFEREHGARLNLIYFETDDDRDALLVETEGRGYDVVLVNGSNLASYVRRGWLEPLDTAALSQLEHIDPRWRDAYQAAESHGVPYLWGTLGIAYRRDLVGTEPQSWMDLFEPEEALRGRIVMVNTARVSVALALKALGHSANSTEPAALDAAERLLMAQRPWVKAYGYVDITEDSALLTGEVAAAIMYSGDALALEAQHPEVRYTVPVEGGELWVDYWTVLSASPNKALAWAFIDFMTRPENAARTTISLNYPSPNRAAESLLPREILDNPAIYPDADTLRRSEVLGPLPPRVTRRVLSYFAQLVSASVRDQDTVARGQPEPSPVARQADGEMVARLGGDEFIVLLRGLQSPADVLRVTGRVLKALETPFVHDGVSLMLRSSIGVAFYPQDGDNAEQLMQRADFAMYRAKQDDTQRVWFYRDALVEERRDLMDLQ